VALTQDALAAGKAPPAPEGGRRRPRLRGATRLGIAMIAPAVLYIVALVGLPLFLAFLYSVGDVRVGSVGYHYVGLDNFRSVLESPSFRRALGDSIIFTTCTQVIVIVVGNALALALRDRFRGRGIVRFLILLPWVAPISLGAIGWKWILDSIYSVVNWTLAQFHLVNLFDPPMWLGEPKLAMASVIAVHSWRMIPFSTVILLAGLTSIPRDIPEAAAVDGAGFWRTHFEITLPMMTPIINVAVLFGIVFTFTDMTVVYILTRGGPYDSTQVLPSLAFFTGVLGSDLAEGAAISVFLVPILVAVAALMLRVAHRAEVA
jgi:multiple sugar transport system permease protein